MKINYLQRVEVTCEACEFSHSYRKDSKNMGFPTINAMIVPRWYQTMSAVTPKKELIALTYAEEITCAQN